MGAVTKTLDERFKETVTGDKNYRLGDKTRQAVQKLMVMANEQDYEPSKRQIPSEVVISDNEMDSALVAELAEWDRRLGITAGNETSAASPTKS